MIDGYMYLHTNGDLIYKKAFDGVEADLRESGFVRMFWPIDIQQRYDAWRCLVEAKALGANESRIDELAKKWGCHDDDADNFANCLGLQLFIDGASWCAVRADFVNLAESPAGFGDSCLDAISELLNALGFKPCKTWGHTIKDLCQTGE